MPKSVDSQPAWTPSDRSAGIGRLIATITTVVAVLVTGANTVIGATHILDNGDIVAAVASTGPALGSAILGSALGFVRGLLGLWRAGRYRLSISAPLVLVLVLASYIAIILGVQALSIVVLALAYAGVLAQDILTSSPKQCWRVL